jgi:hypothetical protein
VGIEDSFWNNEEGDAYDEKIYKSTMFFMHLPVGSCMWRERKRLFSIGDIRGRNAAE